MAIVVRPYRLEDVPWMAAIRALESGTKEFWVDRIGRYLSGTHFPQKALATRTAFVALEDGARAGFVAGHQTERYGCDGELQWINVARERRGSGVADQLMATMGAWFVSEAVRRVCVNVDPANAAARKLYERHGARVLNEHWMVWEDAGVMGG